MIPEPISHGFPKIVDPEWQDFVARTRHLNDLRRSCGTGMQAPNRVRRCDLIFARSHKEGADRVGLHPFDGIQSSGTGADQGGHLLRCAADDASRQP